MRRRQSAPAVVAFCVRCADCDGWVSRYPGITVIRVSLRHGHMCQCVSFDHLKQAVAP